MFFFIKILKNLLRPLQRVALRKAYMRKMSTQKNLLGECSLNEPPSWNGSETEISDSQNGDRSDWYWVNYLLTERQSLLLARQVNEQQPVDLVLVKFG